MKSDSPSSWALRPYNFKTKIRCTESKLRADLLFARDGLTCLCRLNCEGERGEGGQGVGVRYIGIGAAFRPRH